MRIRIYQVDYLQDGENLIAKKGRHRVRILRDPKYPTMWRIEHPETKEISNMVNLTRAKDIALGLVESLEYVEGR